MSVSDNTYVQHCTPFPLCYILQFTSLQTYFRRLKAFRQRGLTGGTYRGCRSTLWRFDPRKIARSGQLQLLDLKTEHMQLDIYTCIFRPISSEETIHHPFSQQLRLNYLILGFTQIDFLNSMVGFDGNSCSLSNIGITDYTLYITLRWDGMAKWAESPLCI